MGIPWNGMDGTGINCYGMKQKNMSHKQACRLKQLFVNALKFFWGEAGTVP